jgi:hypothetical protein
MNVSEMHKICKNRVSLQHHTNDAMNDKPLERVSCKLSLPRGKLHNVMLCIHEMMSYKSSGQVPE